MNKGEHQFGRENCRIASMDINRQELWLISGLMDGPVPPWSGVISGEWSNNWLPIDDLID